MAAAPQTLAPLDVAALRREFPILTRTIRGRPLVYLDNGASAQRPQCVIDAERDYASQHHANVHRGVHTLSQEATDLFEAARETVRGFLNARSIREVIFTRGTTEGINLVAQACLRPRLQPGDEILITALEHHANIVPWQLVAEQTGAVLKVIPIDRRGVVDEDAYSRLLTDRTRLVALAQVSNALGTIIPVQRMIAVARARGILTLVDGAQAVPHLAIDVRALDCDFFVFSGHKLYGPTGIGVLYGRESVLESMPPWQGGGDMILTVSFERSTWNALPFKFEAGTPNMGGAVGLAEAIRWLQRVGIERVAAHEHALLEYATARLSRIDGLRIIGTAPDKASLVSFIVDGLHPHDLGTILDAEGIAIRTGHHCAMPVMTFFGVPATARASFAAFNTPAEIDALVDGIGKAREVFG